MSIVQKLVTLMGGTIECVSTKGKGTTFTVILPAELVEKTQGEVTEEKEVDLSILKGKNILLCEDHPLNREIVVKILSNKGCQVVTAEDGAKGVEAFSKHPTGYFAAILMDVRMPNLDGISAAKLIRQSTKPEGKSIPIIAVTANAFEEDVKACLEAGINSHIAKPINPQQMLSELANLIK